MKYVFTETLMDSNGCYTNSISVSKPIETTATPVVTTSTPLNTTSTLIRTSKCTHCASLMASPMRTLNEDKMKFLCIPCKRSIQQKKKEAWLALPDDSPKLNEPVKPVDPCAETNENVLSIANKALVARLECPVCYQLMVPPLRQCRNGHSICSRCNARLNRCPTCRRSFIDTSNVVLNEICQVVAIPCRYYRDGCRQLVRLVDKADHEKGCPWKKCECPETVSGCDWKGSQVELVDHLSKEHAGSISRVVLGRNTSLRYTYGRINPVEKTNAEVDHFNVVSRTVLLLDESGEGIQVFVFSLKYDIVCGSLCAVLRIMGPKVDASNYAYKVKLVSPDGTLRISTTTLSACYEMTIDDVISAGLMMKVDGIVFKKFVNQEGKFYVSFKLFLSNSLTKPE